MLKYPLNLQSVLQKAISLYNYKDPEAVCYEEFFPEILNLWEVQKFCYDPASRSANWDQVIKRIHKFQRNLSN